MKFYNYCMISLGLALLFEFAGMPISGIMLTYLGISSASALTFGTSALWALIFGLGGALIGLAGAILIGTLTRSSPENYIILPIIIATSVLFITPLINISVYAWTHFGGSWIPYVTNFIIAILCLGFIISMWEHFRGTD